MKDLLKVIKDNIKYLIFWSLFGLSVGYNIKQYNRNQYVETAFNDLFTSYVLSLECNADLYESLNESILIIKNNKIKVSKQYKQNANNAMNSIYKLNQSVDKIDSLYISK